MKMNNGIKSFTLFTLAAIPCLAIFLISFGITIDYFDAYKIMNNARAAALGLPGIYSVERSILLPLMLIIPFKLEHTLGIRGLGFTMSHVQAVFFFVLFAISQFSVLRIAFSRNLALLGTCLFTLNPLLLHQAPFAKEDIPSGFFFSLGMIAVYHGLAHKSKRLLLIASLALAAAMAARFNLILLPYLSLVFYYVIDGFYLDKNANALKWKCENIVLKLIFTSVLPISLFLLLTCFTYQAMGASTFWEAPLLLLRVLHFFKTFYSGFQDPLQNFSFIFLSFGLIPSILLVYGLLQGFKVSLRPWLLIIAWSLPFFIMHTFILNQREARYLFPIFPALYFFVIAGFSLLRNRLCSFFPTHKDLVTGSLAFLLLLQPMMLGANEIIKFSDPIYHDNLGGKISQRAALEAGDHNLFWIGNYYPFHPKDYLFHKDDEFTSIYHFYEHVVQFYTGRNCIPFQQAQFMQNPNSEALFPGPHLGRYVRNNDVLIINEEPSPYATSSIPDTLKPLRLQKTIQVILGKVHEDASIIGFSQASLPNVRAQLNKNETPITLNVIGLNENQYYEVYVIAKPDMQPVSFAITESQSGVLSVALPPLTPPKAVQFVMLQTYELLETYYLPQYES